MGLDYSYQVAFAEELGRIRSGGVGMAIGVQTDMATPALANHGSDELRRDFLTPTITGDMVCSIRGPVNQALARMWRQLKRRQKKMAMTI